ncbi:MAG: ABC transporter permease [Bacteroidota bacterium]
MLRSYLTLAWRALRRQAGYALINLVGFAIGLACVLLVVFYLQHEYSYDTYHEKGDRLYRAVQLTVYGGQDPKWEGSVDGDPAPTLRADLPAVEDATRLTSGSTNRVQVEGTWHQDIEMKYGESNLFNLFSFDLLRGDPETVLDRPNTAVITASLAQRLFGEEDPVGQTLLLPNWTTDVTYEITGVIADVPVNTHFTFDLLKSVSTLESVRQGDVYVLLRPDADPAALNEPILEAIRDTGGRYAEDARLEPITAIHFSDLYAERQGDQRYVYLLSAIVVLILLIACANYTNLATARALRRTREVGVRKALGAQRGQLARQFLAETLLLALLAVPLAVVLFQVALPTFNRLAETSVEIVWLEHLGVLGAAVAAAATVGLLAGSYPALFLARFQPVEVLRGQLPIGSGGTGLRKVLVTFQFAASILLIAGTAVIVQQLRFMQTQKLGFNTEQIVAVEITDRALRSSAQAVKQEMLRVPGVQAAAGAMGAPGQLQFRMSGAIERPNGPDEPGVSLFTPWIDADFLEVMSIPLLAGRNVVEGSAADWERTEVLVNEAAIEAMGWASAQDALGQTIGDSEVVGVVPDFHFVSLHQRVAPLAMKHSSKHFGLVLRLAAGDIPATLEAMEAAYRTAGGTGPFVYRFLDEEINQLYAQEQRTASIFGLFAGLAILIACLGLLGLAAYMAAQRTQEIGIRKVLGATLGHLMALLTGDFLKLIGLAAVIALPVAYVFAGRWLEAFAYRMPLNAVPFALAAALVLGLAMLTVGLQVLRAAQANPVEALRQDS